MIRKYITNDMNLVDVQKEQIHELKNGIDFFNYIEAYTLVEEGEILGVFGFDKISDETVQCFALLGKNSGKKIIELVRFLKKEIYEKMKKLKIKKVFMTVKNDFYQAHRMAEILEFRVVKKLPLFFDGYDYCLYERSLVWH